MKKKTYGEVQDLMTLYGCELLSTEYINTRQALDIKCKCGSVFRKTLASMNRYKKYMCNECSDKEARKNRMIKYEDIRASVEREGYSIITLESEYTGTGNKLKLMCPQGHVYEVGYYEFHYRKHRCVKCYNQKTRDRLTMCYSDVAEYVSSIGYTLLTKECEYIDTKHYVYVKCDKDHIYKTKVNTLRNGKRCRKCSTERVAKGRIIPYENRKLFVESYGFKLITLEEDYTKSHGKCEFECDKGHRYVATMSDFQQGCRCPICKTYKGEKSIMNILDCYNIEYIFQYKFDGCKHYNKLPFDFYLPNFNTCIEYDGKQHFQYVHSWGGFDEFVNRLIRDSIKNIYCRDNNIKLIRIPYYEFENIENILLNELKLKYDNTEVNN